MSKGAMPYVGYDATQRLLLNPDTFVGSTVEVRGVKRTDGGGSVRALEFHENHLADFWSVYCGERQEDEAILTFCLGDFETQWEAKRYASTIRGAMYWDRAIDAMALWEAVLDADGSAHPVGQKIRSAFEDHGTCEMRDIVATWAPTCWEEYRESDANGNESFDWEWCPRWLRERIDWDAQGSPQIKPKETA